MRDALRSMLAFPSTAFFLVIISMILESNVQRYKPVDTGGAERRYILYATQPVPSLFGSSKKWLRL